MNLMGWIWLAAMIVFAIVEGATSTLVSVWFVGGAFAAMLAAMLGAELWLQLVLFLAVSAVLIVLLRPLARKLVSPKLTATNAAANIGKQAVVTEQIDNLHGKGAAKIAGIEWSARSVTGEIIEKGAVVCISAIEGVKICVERIKEEKP